jgi:hypothetical protein
MTTAQWIAVALLAPFWWAMGLLLLALVADVSPRSRQHVFALFDWLERTRRERPIDVPTRVAA